MILELNDSSLVKGKTQPDVVVFWCFDILICDMMIEHQDSRIRCIGSSVCGGLGFDAKYHTVQ